MSSPHDSNTVNDTANSTVQDGESIDKSKLRSPIWDHFDLKMIKGTQMVICNYCNKKLVYKSSNGTKGLIGHNKICKTGKTQKTMDEFQSRLVAKKSKADASGSVLATHCFSYEESRKDLVRMIAQHDYPLCMVEHAGFRVFCQGLQPLFKSITRNTAKADLVRVYEDEKTKLMQLLGSIKGRIAITTDMWTSNHQRKGYITLTAHFVDDSWKLQSRLLR